MRFLARALSPMASDGAGGGPMNTTPASGAGLGKGGVLAQEAVAGVQGVGPGRQAPRMASNFR